MQRQISNHLPRTTHTATHRDVTIADKQIADTTSDLTLPPLESLTRKPNMYSAETNQQPTFYRLIQVSTKSTYDSKPAKNIECTNNFKPPAKGLQNRCSTVEKTGAVRWTKNRCLTNLSEGITIMCSYNVLTHGCNGMQKTIVYS